jgi:aminopeptidase N
MDTWTQQTGFPLITISREDNIITATQKRFLVSSHDNDTEVLEQKSPFNYKWYIPLSYYTSKDPKDIQNVWMNMSDGNVFLRNYFKILKITLKPK